LNWPRGGCGASSARQLWLEEVLCAPIVGVTFLRWWMRRKLDHNPIGWLEQRSWSGRIVMWGWLAVMVSLYSTFLTGSYGYTIVYRLQNFMAWLLLVGLAASAAGSFQRERETGVMELLLVSPVTEGRIITGRVRGLWGQFLPAVILLMASWAYLNNWNPQRSGALVWIQFFGVAFITLPVIGLYHSIRWKSFITAFLMTFVTGLVLPLAVKMAFRTFIHTSASERYLENSDHVLSAYAYEMERFVDSGLFLNILQVFITVFIARRLLLALRRRTFAISRAVT
jgi:ABC-type transport system involved in multi-copper enzyme maturation permease subunit